MTTEEDFNLIITQLKKGFIPPRLGYDLTEEQFMSLVEIAVPLMPTYGVRWFIGFIETWRYSADHIHPKEQRLTKKGYDVIRHKGKILLVDVNSGYAGVFNSINSAHKRIFNY